MKAQTRKLAVSAIFTAFAVVFIYLACVFPTGQMGFLAAASLFGVFTVIETGISFAIVGYVTAGVLSFLLVPDKILALVYIAFFGYYPILKTFAEKTRSRTAEWAIKLVVFNLAATIVLFFFSETVFDLSQIGGRYIFAYLLLNIVFIIFDIGVSRLIMFYTAKISAKLKR